MGYLQGRLDGTRFCEGKWHLLWPLMRKENVSKAGLGTFPCEEGVLRAGRSGNQAAAAEPGSPLPLRSLWGHRAQLSPHPQVSLHLGRLYCPTDAPQSAGCLGGRQGGP